MVAAPAQAQAPIGNRVAVRTAGMMHRAMAGVLDGIAVGGLCLVGVWVMTLQAPGSLTPAQGNLVDWAVDVINLRPGVAMLCAMVLAIGVILWHGVTGLIWGASPGKRALGLHLVDGRGSRPGPLRTLVHGLGRLVGTLAFGVGPLWGYVDPERRTLHDRIAGVYVVRGPVGAKDGRGHG